jgi:hypothetical protein
MASRTLRIEITGDVSRMGHPSRWVRLLRFLKMR